MCNAAAKENVGDLSDGIDGYVLGGEAIEQHAGGGRNGVIVAVGGARERAGLAFEGTCDHAAYLVRTGENFTGDLADAVEFRDWNDCLMSGDLKNAISGGIDDRRAGAHVLLAELFNDLGTGGGLVSEGLRPILVLEGGDHSGGKPCGYSGKGFSRMMPAISQWPVVVSFPGEARRHLPYAPAGCRQAGDPRGT